MLMCIQFSHKMTNLFCSDHHWILPDSWSQILYLVITLPPIKINYLFGYNVVKEQLWILSHSHIVLTTKKKKSCPPRILKLHNIVETETI